MHMHTHTHTHSHTHTHTHTLTHTYTHTHTPHHKDLSRLKNNRSRDRVIFKSRPQVPNLSEMLLSVLLGRSRAGPARNPIQSRVY